jgi:hypothetical protein
VKSPTELVEAEAIGDGAGGPELAGACRSAASRSGSKEKDVGGK